MRENSGRDGGIKEPFLGPSSFFRFGDRHAALAICLYVPLTSILPRDSYCSGTFRPILFDGLSILTFTEVDEGLLLAVVSPRFLGVHESSGENGNEGLGMYIDCYFQSKMSSCDLRVGASSNFNLRLLANFSAEKRGQLCSNSWRS